MGERTSHPPGTFSWVDLQTADQAGAKDFYAALLGWEYDDQDVGDGITYSMAQIDGKSVAGLGPLQGDGMPSHWNCYVTVASADEAAARAAELGANVVAPPFDVMEAGRMAAFADPQGAILSVWEPGQSIGAELVNVPGALTWNDLASADIDASAAFYRDLFGWEIAEIEGSDGGYWSITNNGRSNGGIMPLPPGGHPAWNLYFYVEDADATTAKANELGGGTLIEPTDIPNGTRFAILRDPSGAVFSLAAGPVDD